MSFYTHKIEDATVSDHSQLTDLWEASVRATHHFLSNEDILFYKSMITEENFNHVDLYKICVNEKSKNEIVAFMGIAEKKLEMLFIHPDYIGKGLGTFLLQYAIGKLNVDRVDVNEQNDRAYIFYKRMGFEKISRDPIDGSGKPFPILHLKLKKSC